MLKGELLLLKVHDHFVEPLAIPGSFVCQFPFLFIALELVSPPQVSVEQLRRETRTKNDLSAIVAFSLNLALLLEALLVPHSLEGLSRFLVEKDTLKFLARFSFRLFPISSIKKNKPSFGSSKWQNCTRT